MTKANHLVVICDMCGRAMLGNPDMWVKWSASKYTGEYDFCSLECRDNFKEVIALEQLSNRIDDDDEDTDPGLGPAIKN